jgi:hypothetical protein
MTHEIGTARQNGISEMHARTGRSLILVIPEDSGRLQVAAAFEAGSWHITIASDRCTGVAIER